MFDILRKSLTTGIVTTTFPLAAGVCRSRGRPIVDFSAWQDARTASAACPTGALSWSDSDASRKVRLDLGKCTFCGLCAEADPAVRMSEENQIAVSRREALQTEAVYELAPNGIQTKLVQLKSGSSLPWSDAEPLNRVQAIQSLGEQLQQQTRAILGRSLHIREVDAGSCNGCEVEIVGLNSPVYDLERLGIHFVASPRHADMLLVTGPVSRNMELALKKTYEATPEPRVVVAVGACGCGGGIFGQNYASLGGVEKVIPVDVYIPGCPPHPYALLKGILMAVGKWRERSKGA